jgi:hypothetical protein
MNPVSEIENLHAYFDGELPDEERKAIEAMLTEDAEATLAELSLLRQAISVGLEAEAEKIPEARFEQLWDEVERTLERDARLQQAADSDVSLWSRVGAFFKPLWAPTAALAGVAAAAAIYIGSGESEPTENTPVSVASNDGPAQEAADEPMPLAPLQDDRIAANVEADEMPSNNEAEIQRIEFGGKTGRIDRIESKQGITTVIWIDDEDETLDSERAL